MCWRVALAIAVLVGLLAVVIAIAWFAFVQFSSLGKPSLSDDVEVPSWESIRFRVLPLPQEQTTTDAAASAERSATGQRKAPVDERIIRIADNLNAQFQRNRGDERAFTDRYPMRLLEAWVFEDSRLPEFYLRAYLDALVAVSEAIGQDGQINRIGSLDHRAQVIMSALEAFREEFLVQAERAQNRVASAATSRSEAVTSSLYLGLAGLGLLFSLALIVVLLRIESHLRNQTYLQALARGQSLPTSE